MKREYMSEEEFATINARELGVVGAWHILQAPDDWNDRYLWACDGYWLTPVRFASAHGAVAESMGMEEFAAMQQRPDDFTLDTDLGLRFDWNRPGRVNKTWAFRIPRTMRTRFNPKG